MDAAPFTRRRKTSAEKREQAHRADARAMGRLLRAHQAVTHHRGCSATKELSSFVHSIEAAANASSSMHPAPAPDPLAQLAVLSRPCIQQNNVLPDELSTRLNLIDCMLRPIEILLSLLEDTNCMNLDAIEHDTVDRVATLSMKTRRRIDETDLELQEDMQAILVSHGSQDSGNADGVDSAGQLHPPLQPSMVLQLNIMGQEDTQLHLPWMFKLDMEQMLRNIHLSARFTRSPMLELAPGHEVPTARDLELRMSQVRCAFLIAGFTEAAEDFEEAQDSLLDKHMEET